MTGTITRVKDPGGFGFIRPSDGSSDVFFHFSALDGLEFNETLTERRVEFETMSTDRGLKAVFVRPAR